MDAADLEFLCTLAESAGREILQVYAGDVQAWRKDDDSPLTEADLRADACIRAGLRQRFPGVFVLSEESRSDTAAVPGAPLFIVDPLDGTKEFLGRNGEFTVNIAYVDGGEALAGVVHVPAAGLTYWGLRGAGAFCREVGGPARPIAVAQDDGVRELRAVCSRSHRDASTEAWLARLPRPHQSVAGGSSLKFCRLAEGQADLDPRFGPTSQWDTAAPQAVLECAGGAVVDLAGEPLRYGLQRPLVNGPFLAAGPRALLGLALQAARGLAQAPGQAPGVGGAVPPGAQDPSAAAGG